MKKETCVLLDRLLQEGWFETEKEAQAWIMTGRILVNDRPSHSLKEKIPTDSVIRIKEYYKTRYVNKGGLKLEKAFRDFGIDAAGKAALDCGASTGGFTDYLASHGAAPVYAVDAGHGQLAGKLLLNENVVNMERTNISDGILKTLSPPPELITLDLSYLSLKKAIPECREILHGRGTVVGLVKPIFEVDDAEIRRTGKINEAGLLKDVLVDLGRFFIQDGWTVFGLTYSPVTGNRGTLEFFYGLRVGLPDAHSDYQDLKVRVEAAVEAASGLSLFKKNEMKNG